MTVRGFGEKTQCDYIRHVKNFTIFLGRSPDMAEGEDLLAFQVRQREQGVQPPTMNGAVAALRFFFRTTCDRPEMARHLRLVKQPQKLRRRQLRQRSRRDDQRALQSRGDPSAWTLALLEAVEYATLEWVDWFNNRRLLEPIGNVPPAEAEAAYYAALEEPAALAA